MILGVLLFLLLLSSFFSILFGMHIYIDASPEEISFHIIQIYIYPEIQQIIMRFELINIIMCESILKYIQNIFRIASDESNANFYIYHNIK